MDKGSNTSTGVETAPIETFNIRIVGHQYISKKLFEVINHLLVDYEIVDYKAINEIVIHPNEPEGKFGAFNPETRYMFINLEKHFHNAIEMSKDEMLSTLSLRSHLWFGLLTTVIHEIIHGLSYAIDPEKMINDDREAVEEEIRKETAARVADLIRDYDVEPPEMADEPFFGSRYMEFYVKNIKENSEQWAINQNEMHNTGFIFKDGDLSCSTFKEWYRSAYEHAGDPNWDKEPKPLLTAEVEDEVIPKPEETVVEEVKTETTKAVELPAGPVEENVDTPITTVTPEELDPEALALLDMDEPLEIDMEETAIPTDTPTPAAAQVAPYKELVEDPSREPASTVAVMVQDVPINTGTAIPTAISTPAPAPVQQELPLKQAAPQTTCRSCNTVLAESAKFCSQCGTSVVETPMPILPPVPDNSATPALPVAPQPPAQTTFSYGAKRAMRQDLPNYNLSAEQIRACVGEVFIRCYQHIFSKCGFHPAQNPSFAPELRNAIAEPISVVGIPCIDQVLIGMDSVDPMTGNFTWCVPPVNGMIRGKITKNLGLPSYTLYFNFNGHEAKRFIVPQNQWKVSGQGYSGPAQRAQQGAMIIWMMDGDDSAHDQKWRAKIENGTLEWLI